MKFKRTERRVWGTLGALAYLSGALLFALSRFVRIPTAIGEQHHPAEQTVRIAHAVLAYGLVLAFGYLVKSHILPGLRSRQRRRVVSGLGITALFGVLLISALVTLYGGEAPWVLAVALIHGIVGLGCPALILFHAWRRWPEVRARAADTLRLSRRPRRIAVETSRRPGKFRPVTPEDLRSRGNGPGHLN